MTLAGISSNPEIVINDQSGYLINYPDLDMFSEKVQVLIKNETLCQQFGEVGRRSALEKFQLNQSVSEFEQYLLAETQ
jgi:glycosyltransferase involved in cell wall biosynthesis